MVRPSATVLQHNGIKVDVWFMPSGDDGEENKVAVMMPEFGSYDKTDKEKEPYIEASKVVANRLKELGYVVDG